jgi:protease I
MSKLKHRKVAILTEEGFEEAELTKPMAALEEAGAKVHVISSKSGKIKSWDEKDWGKKIEVDKTIADAHAESYDALVLPGGVINPDKLRLNKEAVAFVKAFMESGKPVAAICHGPQTLIETGLLKGRRMTSFPSLKTDLENAGATWVDEEVVQDGNLITSRKPADIPAFNKKLIESLMQVGLADQTANG